MKLARKRSIFFSVMICAAGFLIQTGMAQDSKADSVPTSFPVLPITVEFRVVPQFFRQPLNGESKYSSVDAFVNSNDGKNPWYEVILRERASSKQIYYCNSQQTVAMLTGRGEQAYYAPIEFNSSQDSGSHAVFTFHFQDSSQQSIQWRFVPGPPAAGKEAIHGFMARTDDSGFVLLRIDQQMSASPGTVFSMGDEQHPADKEAFYAPNVLLADIPPVTEQWNVVSAPSQLRTGDKWVLRNKTGTESPLTVKNVSGDQMSMEMTNSSSPDSTVQLEARQSANQYSLSSVKFMNQGHWFRISFEPGLPMPAAMITDKTTVKFTMDEDSNASAASGELTASRGLGDEHLQWQFESPDWAKSKRLTTGVNILFGAETKELKKPQNAIP